MTPPTPDPAERAAERIYNRFLILGKRGHIVREIAAIIRERYGSMDQTEDAIKPLVEAIRDYKQIRDAWLEKMKVDQELDDSSMRAVAQQSRLETAAEEKIFTAYAAFVAAHFEEGGATEILLVSRTGHRKAI